MPPDNSLQQTLDRFLPSLPLRSVVKRISTWVGIGPHIARTTMKSNCANCGARLTLNQYQDRVKCDYCDSVHIPSLKDDSLVQKLEGVSSPVECPICSEGLSHAKLENWTFLYCGECHGLLIEGEHLSDIVVYCRRDKKEPFREPEPVDPSDLVRKIRCPCCAKTMFTHEYYGPGDFVIDFCRECGRIWLDAGELARSSDVKWGGALWR